jgi:cytochrome c oxidase subunit 2
MFSLFNYLKNTYYRPQDHMGFKDPATSLMEQIIELHHFIFFFLLLISGLVLWLLIQILDNFIYLYHFNTKSLINTNFNLNKFLIYTYGVIGVKTRKFNEHKYLEACWTSLPAFILIIISIPSFYMLYLSDESIETLLTVKAVGFQWYWTYDFTDLFPFWYNLKTSELDMDDFLIESYMEPLEFFNIEEGEGKFRLLETDNILMLPTNLHLRLIITSMDTLHSFALPSLGVKVDAIPGRLNKIDIFIYRMGVFYGQCSEICGIGHGFMPICLYAISYLNLLIGDF